MIRTCPFKLAPESSKVITPSSPHTFPDGTAIPSNACTAQCAVFVATRDDKGNLGGNCGIVLGGVALVNLELSMRAVIAQSQPPQPSTPSPSA